jgi:hypothetical protein
MSFTVMMPVGFPLCTTITESKSSLFMVATISWAEVSFRTTLTFLDMMSLTSMLLAIQISPIAYDKRLGH